MQQHYLVNIPPFVLLIFYGMPTKDPYALFFCFFILCHTYGYKNDAQKICLFPATLKGVALKWFMGLEERISIYWGN